jgi:hypothetical protein
MTSPRRCRHARAVLPFVDGELSTELSLHFEEHLRECQSCAAAVAAQRALEDALVALPRPALPLVDRARLLAGIEARVVAAEAAAPRPMLRLAPRRVAAVAALAAALALGVWLAWPRAATTTSPSANDVAAHDATTTSDGAGVELAPDAPVEAAVTPSPEPVDPSFETRGLGWPVVAAARDELAQAIRRLPASSNAIASDDLLGRFLAAVQPLRAAGVPLPTVMLGLLRDPDAAFAASAADLFARAARAGELGNELVTLVPRIEDVTLRPDRAAAMVRVLVAIGTPRAWEAVMRAAQREPVRLFALRALAEHGEPPVLATLSTQLQQETRAPDGAAHVADVLAALHVRLPEHVRLLGELQRGGVDATTITAALRRDRETSTVLLAEALADGAARRDALALAPLLGDDALAAPLAALVTRGGTAAPALAAMEQIGGARTLAALIALGNDPSLPNSRARQVGRAFVVALARTEPLAGALAQVRASAPGAVPLLVELCRLAPGEPGRRARVALLAQPELANDARARLAVEIAARREPIDREQVLAWLTEVGAHREPSVADGGLTASLLVLLYVADGEAGLESGTRALGLPMPRQRRDRLRDAARLVMNGRDPPRDLARLDALLPYAP